MYTILILISTTLDVVSTHVGVLLYGNGEVSPFARLVMNALGYSWWIVYFPYEASILLAAFFGVRYLRSKLATMISTSILKMPIELLILFASYTTILNNTVQLLIRLGTL